MSETNDSIINIIFDPGRGRCETRTAEAEIGKSFGTLPRARREGYEFEGWFTSADGGVRVSTGDEVCFDSDTKLFAHWKKAGDHGLAEKKRERSMLRRQQTAIIVMAVLIVLLAVALAAVNYIVDIYYFSDEDGTTYQIKKDDGVYGLYHKNGARCTQNDEGYYLTDLGTQLSVDGETGEYEIYAVVHTEGTENVGFSDRVLMFKQLIYDESSTLDKSIIIKSIEVHNEFGSYTFERNNDTDMDFVIKGLEDTAYNQETFASLAVACGYTISRMRLETPKLLPDGGIDWAEYGLAAEERVKTELDEDGNEVEITYSYQPAWYVITTMTGESHKVIIGDMIVDGTGYYARYEGRDTIYVLGSNGFENGVLQKIEKIITPLIVYPMSANSYFDVANFKIYKNIDHDGITRYLLDKYGEAILDMDEEEFTEAYAEAFEANSEKICNFSYQDLTERANSMYSALPYVSHLEYSGGYYINSDNVSNMLYLLSTMKFVEVTKLSPTDEDFEAYGLDAPAYTLDFLYHTTDDKGEDIYIANLVEISEKTEDGLFYAYSETFDMIVCADESAFEFLEWDEVLWYDPSYFQLDISYLTDLIVESPDFSTHFEFENSASKRAEYFAQTGNKYTDKTGKVYSITKNSSGKYVLTLEGEEVLPIYTGDYMVGALVYKEGVNEYGDYAFVEAIPSDTNGDGEDDVVTYYYYFITKSQGKYALAAQIVNTDVAGNQLSAATTTVGKPYYASDYFVTKSGYLFLTDESSYMGKQLSEEYLAYGRGEWHTGEIFSSADGKYILVDSQKGTWSTLADTSSSLYFGDKQNSVLAKSAVSTLPMYDASGKLTRNAETYYPKTASKLGFDEETGKIRVYDSSKKEWRNATFDDCTLGLWNKGSYYLMEDGGYIIVNEETGDWGIMTVTSTNSTNAEVFVNGVQLDYMIKTATSTGRVQDSDEVYNFRQFYRALLYASIEGMAELTEEEMAALRATDDFSSDGASDTCQLKLTVLARDLAGNERNLVYRFYRYSERHSYMTIEVLDSADPSGSQSEKGYGSFYVLGSFVEKLISDAEKVVNGEVVTSVTKY